MALYDRNNPQENNADKDYWQRQKDIFDQLKAIEIRIFDAIAQESTQTLPMSNQQFVKVLLAHTTSYYFLISPHLSDKKGTGINSEKSELYKEALGKARQLYNTAQLLGFRNAVGQAKLNQAYVMGMDLFQLLKQEVADLELDFKKKKSVYEAWKD